MFEKTHVVIFFIFSLANFSRPCSFPLPAEPRGGLDQQITNDSVPSKIEALRKTKHEKHRTHSNAKSHESGLE
jgi:hypothetical protein